MVSAVNLNGATLLDGAGKVANLSLTGLTQGSPRIDTTPPTVSSVTGTAGDYNAGKPLTLTLNMSEAVTVTGTPTLTLNDGGTATYVGGSGTSALTFSYTVAAGQNTPDLDGDSSQPAARGHDRRRFRERRQSGAEQRDPKQPADRHHNADHHRDQRFAADRRSERGRQPSR